MTTTPVVEHGLLTIKPGTKAAFETAMREALPLISSKPGFGGVRVAECVERPGTYLLLVEWDSLEAHTEGFRKSPEYEHWRAALHPFYDPFPTIEHFVDVATA
jgi:heme-degrading monooxygenase HmoA